MTGRTYENIQGVLSTFALAFGALFVGAGIDYTMLKSEADLSAFGAELYPTLIGVSGLAFAVIILLKLWGAFALNGFYLKIQIAEKFYSLANTIDPRRKS